MADIFQDLPIRAAPADVFRAMSTPAGLDRWWTKRSTGEPKVGATYDLWFGPEFGWRAGVTRCQARVTRWRAEEEFELAVTDATADWLGTRVGFRLDARDGLTVVRFHHVGWLSVSEHYRASCHCWALYLRILRRHLEHGEAVPYEQRLDA